VPRLNLIFLSVLLCIPSGVFAHGGGLNKYGCHNNRSTGDYHCHRNAGKSPKDSVKKPASFDENYFNNLLAQRLNGAREVNLEYQLPNGTTTNYVVIDIVTDRFVIEGGLDKRSSLDSIQQALFASTLSGKKPAVAIYDTDGKWGKYEHRIFEATKKIGMTFIWFDGVRLTFK
jgi:hypothetical protein